MHRSLHEYEQRQQVMSSTEEANLLVLNVGMLEELVVVGKVS